MKAALTLLSQPDRPTALFCSNDEMALGVIWACQRLGLSIPRDLSVVGVDNANWSPFIQPRLTTIAQPSYDMAVSAVDALVQLIESGEAPISQQFQPELIIRDSTASPR